MCAWNPERNCVQLRATSNQLDQPVHIEALRELAEAGAIWRYGREGITDKVRDRLNLELRILAEKNISAYFLIVWDLRRFAEEAKIRVGPGRGSADALGGQVLAVLGDHSGSASYRVQEGLWSCYL